MYEVIHGGEGGRHYRPTVLAAAPEAASLPKRLAHVRDPLANTDVGFDAYYGFETVVKGPAPDSTRADARTEIEIPCLGVHFSMLNGAQLTVCREVCPSGNGREACMSVDDGVSN